MKDYANKYKKYKLKYIHLKAGSDVEKNNQNPYSDLIEGNGFLQSDENPDYRTYLKNFSFKQNSYFAKFLSRIIFYTIKKIKQIKPGKEGIIKFLGQFISIQTVNGGRYQIGIPRYGFGINDNLTHCFFTSNIIPIHILNLIWDTWNLRDLNKHSIDVNSISGKRCNYKAMYIAELWANSSPILDNLNISQEEGYEQHPCVKDNVSLQNDDDSLQNDDDSLQNDDDSLQNDDDSLETDDNRGLYDDSLENDYDNRSLDDNEDKIYHDPYLGSNIPEYLRQK